MQARLLALLLLAATAAGAATAAAPIPTPIGIGPRYRIEPASPAVAHGRPVGRFACRTRPIERDVAHLELFANGLVLLLPPGIGMAPPLRLERLSVTSARCSYAIRTSQPTGVLEFVRGRRVTLGDFFAIWGQPLSTSRLAGFRARRGDEVKAWVGGRRWRGDVRAIPLRHHDEIVVELGGYIPPHTFYGFPRTP
jgi:hypothetical protein